MSNNLKTVKIKDFESALQIEISNINPTILDKIKPQINGLGDIIENLIAAEEATEQTKHEYEVDENFAKAIFACELLYQAKYQDLLKHLQNTKAVASREMSIADIGFPEFESTDY